MGGAITILFLVSYFLLLLLPSAPHPLCTDSKAPFTPQTPLVFCPYDGSVCCDSNQDLGLQKLFQAMSIPDPACASVLKSILCAKCDQFSADLFKIESGTRTVPVLCTVPANSALSTGSAIDFCANVRDTCQNVSISNSPFVPSERSRTNFPVNSTSYKLTELWQSKSGFCKAFGGSSDDGAPCFDGKSASLHKSETPKPPNGICLEKISNGSYLDMVAHPDGSNRVFVSNLRGKIWLATVPEEGSGKKIVLDESNPFLDITDLVHFDTELGLMSIASHPNFVNNGRFFVSYNCDRSQGSGCSGRCSCNTDVNCDPSKISPRNGAMPCQYFTVISEFTANGSESQLPLATKANPSEVRRIFTMGLSYTLAHGGQILFGPDGYLYLMTGDTEDLVDPYNFPQNKKSLLGKILRFDVDNLPSATEIRNLDLWGNYSIPKDNPHSYDKELLPEIWALGFGNPWRCSFDSERPSYFVCGDTGQDQYEEVDIVTKGGNYGWRLYEGTTPIPLHSSGENTSTGSNNLIFPVMGYNHSVENTNEGSASIAGGYFYRSKTDPCLYGRYLYSDLYGVAIWAGTENPENSGNFTTAKLPYSCARNSPIQCSSVGRNSRPSLGYVFSLGMDNRKDVFLLTSNGLLRVVRPSRCNYTCSKENLTADQKLRRGSSPSNGSDLRNPQKELLLVFSSILLLLHFTLQDYTHILQIDVLL